MGSRIVERLISERDAGYSNGIYVATQLQFAWNSNHMEGSTLTLKQTAQIFNTGTFTMDGTERVSVDDAIETRTSSATCTPYSRTAQDRPTNPYTTSEDTRRSPTSSATCPRRRAWPCPKTFRRRWTDCSTSTRISRTIPIR